MGMLTTSRPHSDAATRYLFDVLGAGIDDESRRTAEKELANRGILIVKARELQANDKILAWRHPGHAVQRVKNWVVAAPFGPVRAADGVPGIALHKPDPGSSYELNLWPGTDWNEGTVFFIDRA